MQQSIIAKEKLFEVITDKVFTPFDQVPYVSSINSDAWLFDFRKVLMNGTVSEYICTIFEDQFKHLYPFQICSLEVAGVPLATALMKHMYAQGYTDINAFFIRKSRKKSDLLKMIEGEIIDDIPILLVDDLMNTGSSFTRQVEVLDALEHKILCIWSILRFRDLDYYKRFINRNILVSSIFCLNDFTSAIDNFTIHNLIPKKKEPLLQPYKIKWKFSAKHPNFKYVCSKSQPVVDKNNLYVGSDSGNIYCLSQEAGEVLWQYSTKPSAFHKGIFSDPVLYKNIVIFGGYDGYLYFLDKHNGSVLHIFGEADYIGSSPCVDHAQGYVYVGLEFGLIKKHGGIVCIDINTGKKVWGDYTHPALTHSSPLHINSHSEVVIGSNDGAVRLYDSQAGILKWKMTTTGGADYKPIEDGGFGRGDIKDSFVYYAPNDYLIFGSIDGFLYVISRNTGSIVHFYKTEFGIFSTPCLYGDLCIFTSTDKHVRAINLHTLEIEWDIILDNTRIFSTPVIVDELMYIGTNGARLFVINPKNGEKIEYFQGVERITNKIAFNKEKQDIFISTFANEIIKINRDV